MSPELDLDRRAIDAIRFLSVDAVQHANSGHPGLPMGAAPMAYVLWTRFLRHSRRDSRLAGPRPLRAVGRPRLDAAVRALHLTGYDLPLDRSSSSASGEAARRAIPSSHDAGRGGHHRPLGQGIANAVGMAIAEAHLAARFNRPGHEIVDHRTYVLASDGDMMEGVQSRGRSLAGHLRLGKLIVLYDDNHDHALRHHVADLHRGRGARASRAYGWHVQRVADGNDLAAIDKALARRRRRRERPSLIVVRTIIGFGAPHKQGTFEAHGSPARPGRGPRGQAEPRLAAGAGVPHPRRGRGALPRAPSRAGRTLEQEWRRRLAAYARGLPRARPRELARRLARRAARGLGRAPARVRRRRQGPWPRARPRRRCCRRWRRRCPSWSAARPISIRRRSPGSRSAGDFEPPSLSRDGAQGAVGGGWSYAGRNIHFGVREHAMGAIVERPGLPRRLHPVRRDVPRLLRLHAAADPAGGARAPGLDLRLHARQHRPRRGRPDAPAGRAPRRAARDPRPARDPARRRQRDARGLAGRDREPASPDRCWRSRARRADARPRALRAGRGPAPRRLRPRTRPAAPPDLILIATGSEVQLIVAAAARLGAARRRRAPGVDAVLGAVRRAARRLSRARAAAGGDGARRGRGRPLARLGALGRLARRHRLDRSLRRLGAGRRGDEAARASRPITSCRPPRLCWDAACREHRCPASPSARRTTGASVAPGRRPPARHAPTTTSGPDPAIPEQRVAFGTSGHRGSSFDGAFNEAHILADHPGHLSLPRRRRASTGRSSSAGTPTRCRSPRGRRALEVLAANGVDVMLDARRRRDADAGRLARHPRPQPRPTGGARRRHRGHALAQPARGRRLQVQPAVAAAPPTPRSPAWIQDGANALPRRAASRGVRPHPVRAGAAGADDAPLRLRRRLRRRARRPSSTSTRSAARGSRSASIRWAAPASRTGRRSPSATACGSTSSTAPSIRRSAS